MGGDLSDRSVFKVGSSDVFSLSKKYAGRQVLVGLSFGGVAYIYAKKAVLFGGGTYVTIPVVITGGTLAGHRVKVFAECLEGRDIVQSIGRAVDALSNVAKTIIVAWKEPLDREVVIELLKRGYLLMGVSVKAQRGAGRYYIYEFVKREEIFPGAPRELHTGAREG